MCSDAVQTNALHQDKDGIAIGVIGPAEIIRLIRDALKAFPSFIPVFREYENESEVPQKTKDIIDHVEVLLFSDYPAYKHATEAMQLKIPAHYIPLMGTGLYRSIYRIKNCYDLKSLSVDSLTEQYVQQILKELGESVTALHFYGHSIQLSTDEVIAFHKENYENEKCSVCLTGIKTVAEGLTRLGIPNEWVLPTRQDIIVSLERALLSTETRRNKESQIVVGIIHIDEYRKLMDQSTSQHEAQTLKLEIYRILLDYVKQLDGHLIQLDGEEFLFFTTRGVFERETRGYKFIPLLNDTQKLLGHSLSIGIGFGRTATDAGMHARMALRQSKDTGGNVCFIVREDRSVIGPVEMTDPMIYELSVTDNHLLEKAKKAGMSATYMSRLMAQVTRYGKIDYTPQELASVLGITVRSTHRILVQWMDAGLVEIVGEEKFSHRGRPRQIYRFTFMDEQRNRKHKDKYNFEDR
ncbi:hypothetical protein [Caldalkalibacillus uzonensis]|uniref:hypothetical protein n=1 Tax=Caldalkalibacillus uzonensis TaxID=353224 RepID=UPI0027D83AF1|nr:hypothetical protein [Caldalkalibacillus uzonensis]